MLRLSQPNTSDAPARLRSGTVAASMTAVVSGLAVFINGFGVRAWSGIADATTYTTMKNAVAAAVLAAVAAIRLRSRRGGRATTSVGLRRSIGLLAVAVIGGSVPFVLFFEGFARAGSSQAAFIHKTLVVWVVILAVVFLRERIGWLHVAAVGLLLSGQAVMLGGAPTSAPGSGEMMMLAATLLWSVEVIVAKRMLTAVPALTLGVARMAGGAVLLLAYGLVRGGFGELGALGAVHWMWVGLTGLVLAGYVAGWYAALARAQAADVTAVLVGGALITGILDGGLRGLAVSPVGLGLVGLGVAIAAYGMWRRTERAVAA